MMKVIVGLLILVVGMLLGSLYTLDRTRSELVAMQRSNETVILDFSSRWTDAQGRLDEQRAVNLLLETNLADRTAQLEELRLEIATLSEDLARSRSETRSAYDEIAQRDNQINSLESRNVDLNQEITELQTAINSLKRQISEAERRIAASEGNRQDLMEELRRLQGEKLAMERQLNDLSFLREQVRKLKDELTIARRLDWIRRGIYSTTPRKGGEMLANFKFGNRKAASSREPDSPSLDVELRQSGEVSVRPSTNLIAPSR